MDPFKGSPLKEQCLFQLLCNYFIYLIGQNFVGQTFCRTRFWTPILNFDNFIRFLPDFCIKILDKILDGQNVTSDKIFDAKPKFRQFCPTKFCPIRCFTNSVRFVSKPELHSQMAQISKNWCPPLVSGENHKLLDSLKHPQFDCDLFGNNNEP